MRKCFLIISLIALLLPGVAFPQNPGTSCGQKEVTDRLFINNPHLKVFQQQIEKQLQAHALKVKQGLEQPYQPNAIVTLPVVVHIIHNNGPENLSDAQVFTAIQHLNEAFANTGYYDPADGVNTEIQFCLAQRDPNNNPTKGIDRVVSPLTVMSGWNDRAQDIAVKNLSRWDPRCYINIWIVREITSSVAGYAYLPSAHGMDMDGIVGEAAYFGSSNANDILIIHEMGHYLGLYHTFEGGCTNNDCNNDGDQVCDTPPDQSTAGIGCNSTANSCSTDALSGFSTDVNDLHKDYLDYGNWNCMKVFTQGQATRMNWMIQNVRRSLLNCNSCMTPCPTPVTANFSSSGNDVLSGTTVNFTNSSVNASGYKWYINNTLQTTTSNFSYTFNTIGTYIIKLWGLTNNTLCDSAVKFDTVRVTCPVTASFTPGFQTVPINTNINFTNTSSGAITYQWLMNGVLQSAAINYSHVFNSAGYYEIKLRAINGLCYDSALAIINVIDTTYIPPPPGPVDSCGRSTFQKLYSSQYGLEFSTMNPTRDGGTIHAGLQRRTDPSQINALVTKLDKLGNVKWSTAVVALFGSQFYQARETRDGGVIAVGTTRIRGNESDRVLLVKFTATGAISWLKTYQSATGYCLGYDVIELSTDQFAIVGNEHVGLNVYGLLLITDQTGNINLSKLYRTQTQTTFNSIVQSADTLAIGGSYNNSTTVFGTVLTVNVSTGAVIKSVGFQLDNRGNGGNIIYKQPYGYFLSSFMLNNQNWPYKHNAIIRLNHNLQFIDAFRKDQTVEVSLSVSIPIHETGYLIPATTDNGFTLMAVGQDNNPTVWGNIYGTSVGRTEPINPIALDDGYYLAGARYSSLGKTNFLLVKTDQSGQTPDCNATPPMQSTIAVSANISNLQWDDISDFVDNADNRFFFLTEPIPITISILCNKCDSIIIPPDTCSSITFQKKIGGAGVDHAFDIKALANNEYIIAGSTTSTPGTGNNEEALIIKLNNKGNILWQKSIGGYKKDQYNKIVVNAAGEYLVFGKTESQHNANGSMLLTKFDANGVILWAKEYNFTNASLTGFENVTGAIELVNGDIAFCANALGINTDVGQPLPATFNIIGVLSNTGSLKWVKRFREYYTESGAPVTGIIAMNNSLFVSAPYGIMKMTVADGTLQGLQKKFQNLGSFNSIEPYGSQIMIYSQTHQLVLDQNLNLVSAQMMLPLQPGYLLTANGFSSENGTGIQGDYFKSNADYSVFLSRFNEAGNYRWNYRYPYPNSEYRGLSGSRNTIDNGVVSIGTRYRKLSDISNEPADIFILRTDSLGRIPDCPRASFVPGLLSVQGTYLELHARTYPISTQIFDLTLQELNPQLTVQSLCATEDCSTLILSAKDTVCSFSDTVQVKAYKDTACDAFTEWIVDTTVARIISQNDSILTLQFRRAGVYTIYARLTGGCRLLQDSVTLTVFNSPDSVYLGPDIQICKLSTYTFKAGAGFKSYQWQDGSMDSTLTIYYPGTYHVTAEDYCGNLYRDTVVVSQSPDVPFDLGLDLKKCNNDTLTITAPVGFNKYYWSPVYRIDSLYSRSIKVSPDKDTTYTVIAERSPGCLVTDSIRVTVNHSIPIQLGNDTSFCVNDSIAITATPGFTNYQWNTGSNSQSILVKAAGQYRVSATDNNGCISRDSLDILPLFTLPAVNIGADLSVCTNTIHEFDAGNFTTYLWQDGSGDRRFRTSKTGTYWVRVSDANGCINQDTATIIGYLEGPKNFLDSSADICEGQLLEIKAKVGYNRYRWFNNTSSSTINVTAPGIYWVEVTNAEGCTIRDSISVKAKDCVKGVFFPNAFTPSNGGKNNFFRPTVNGQLESFYLIVYNRYGQKVFETRDAYKGWDGKINGVTQNTNTFAWSAIYKFIGASEKQQTAKGTVTVIR